MNKLFAGAMLAAAGMSLPVASWAAERYVGVAVSGSDHVFKIGYNSGSGPTTTSELSRYRGSLKLFGGVDMTPVFGLEIGYTDLRDTAFNTGMGTFVHQSRTGGSRSYLAGRARMQLNEALSVYGKLGVSHYRFKIGASSTPTYRISNNEVYAGIGGQYALSPTVALTLEYERYGRNKIQGASENAVSIGARFQF